MAYPLHGGQLPQIAERFGIDPSQLLDFSANINPAGPPASVLTTLRKSLDDPSVLTDYPDLQELKLKKSIARYAGVGTENISVANGFVPLLEAALRTLKIRNCLLPVPGFVEYRRTLERAGVEIHLHELRAESNFSYSPTALVAEPHDAILLANPQNPSGVCHNAKTLHDLVSRATETNTFVFLDEAFIDYIPEHSLTTAVDRLPNLIAFRSVTKFHGIPGLRVAYAVSHRERASSLSENLPPWPITNLASRAVSAALEDQLYIVRSRAENVERRTLLQSNLEQLGLQVYPSAANFLLFRLPATVDPDDFWQHMIVAHRIVLRSCANYEALPAGHFRVAVRMQEENARLSTAIAESLSHFDSAR
jgi:threonine-phosphate decarboxylase